MSSAKNTFKLLNKEKEKVTKGVLEFAEMSILLARNKFPGNYFKQAQLISNKFNEKYKDQVVKLKRSWNCSVFAIGNGSIFCYYYHIIDLEFNNMIYSIWI